MINRIAVPDQRLCDVVFIHGLGGDSEGTWAMPGVEQGTWPALLAQDLQNCAVYSLDYPASPSAWLGHTMPIADRSRSVLQEMIEEGLGDCPIFFVCHSLGGLIAKQVLRTSHDLPRHEWGKIASRACGIVFLATPHAGSRLADYFNKLSTLLRTTKSVKELESSESNLRDLNIWFRENVGRLNIKVSVYCEAKLTKGIRVVDDASSDPGITGVVPIHVDEDHLTISKPVDSDSTVYKGVLHLIRDIVSSDLNLGKSDTRIVPVPNNDEASITQFCGSETLGTAIPRQLTVFHDWEDSILIDATEDYLKREGVLCEFLPLSEINTHSLNGCDVSLLWTMACEVDSSLISVEVEEEAYPNDILYLTLVDSPPTPTGVQVFPLQLSARDVIQQRFNKIEPTHTEIDSESESANSLARLLEKALELNEYTPFDLLTDKYCSSREARSAIEDAYFYAVYRCAPSDKQRKTAVAWYAAACRFCGDWPRALHVLADESIPVCKEKNASAALHISFELLSLEFELGKVTDAYERAKEILERALAIADWPCIVSCHRLMGMIMEEQGHIDSARDHSRRGLTYAEELAETDTLSSLVPSQTARKVLVAECMRELAGLEVKSGDTGSAKSLLKKARMIVEENDVGVFKYLWLLIEHQDAKLAYAERVDYDVVIRRLKHCYEELKGFLNPIRLTVVLETIVGMDFDFFRGTKEQVKKVEFAIRKLRRVRELRQHHFTIARARQLEGALLLARCHWEDSLTTLRKVRNEFNRLGKSPEAAGTARMMAHCCISLGRKQDAYRILQEALGLIDKHQQPELWSTLSAEISRTGRSLGGMLEVREDGELTTIGEFVAHKLIREDLATLGIRDSESSVVVGIGDDGAVIELGKGKQLVASTDSVPAELVSSHTAEKARYAARFAVVSSLSDILAMGGRPVGMLVNIHTRRSTSVEWIRTMLGTMAREAEKYGVAILGGDLKEGSYDSVATVALGEVTEGRVLTRSGVRPGDYLAITNTSVGARVFGARWAQELLPFLSQEERKLLAGIVERNARASDLSLPFSQMWEVMDTGIANAGIDTSDGLLACVELMGNASNVGIVLSSEALEDLLDPCVVALSSVLGISPFVFAFSAGHEWEIVLSISPEFVSEDGRCLNLPTGSISQDAVKIIGRAVERNSDDLHSTSISLVNDKTIRVPYFTDEKFAVSPVETRPKQWLEFAREATRYALTA